MGQEIERKFLVSHDGWRQHAVDGIRYIQGYLANNDRCSVRVRVAGDKAWLNIKGATLDITRQEFDYPIPASDATDILECLCERPFIDKTRYFVQYAGHQWEIDVFAGDNEGLIVAEIELDTPDEPIDKPDWVSKEVSDDPRYYNVCLVKHPYQDWETPG